MALIAGFGYAITQRLPLELDIIRDRMALYRETNQGLVENVYTLKLINMDEHSHTYRIGVSGLDGIELVNRGGDVAVKAGEVAEIPVQVRVDPVSLKRVSSEIYFSLQALDRPDLHITEKTRFIGPAMGD